MPLTLDADTLAASIWQLAAHKAGLPEGERLLRRSEVASRLGAGVDTTLRSVDHRGGIMSKNADKEPKKVWRRPQWRARNVRTHC
jgi:hypothetical protein